MACASFDVFDTCLCRRLIAPSEVFRQIGRAFAGALQHPDPETFAADFIEWRMEAERRARQKSPREDIRLAEIWTELHQLANLSKATGIDGVAIELETEFSVLAGIEATRTHLAATRAAGHTVVFISDMYLPADFLRRCLRAHGMMIADEPVYVSGETGVTKRTGNLFRHVLVNENIPASALQHCGDDPFADVEVPRSLGIAATHFTATHPNFIERLLLTQPIVPEPHWIETAGELRAARLSAPDAGARQGAAAEALVDEFLGPFLCVLGHWVLHQARQDGVERLFFAARDARLLWSACRELSSRIDRPIDCRYFHLSRQAVLLPSTVEISAEGMPWLRRDFERASLPRLLAKLELPLGQFMPHWNNEFPGWGDDDALATRAHWDRFWSILGRNEITAHVTRTIGQRRAAALNYFERSGLLDPVQAGFVDLGWFLTCQGAVNRICSARRGARPVRGYYLALMRGRLGPAEAGPATALFHQHAQDLPVPRHHRWMDRNHVLEHIAGIADHASVRAYAEGGQPTFAAPVSDAEIARFRAVEDAAQRYTRLYGTAWAPIGRDPVAAMNFLAALLNGFFQNPNPAIIAGFGTLPSASDQNLLDSEAIAPPFTWSEVLGAWLPHGVVVRFEPALLGARNWPEGSLLATPTLRRVIKRRAALAQRIYSQFGLD